jgi:hypothetical protein
MSDGVQFKATLDITAQSEEIVTAWAIDHLKERGYQVEKANEQWEKPKAFCRRVGIYGNKLNEYITRFEMRGNGRVLVDRAPGKMQRIRALRSCPAFEGFIRSIKRS